MATTGPTMKVTSSSVDSSENAVCSWSGSATRWVHRARTRAPGAPPVAPQTMDGPNSVQAGSCSMASTISSERVAADTIAAGYITRRWPYRSTRFDSAAVPSAQATALEAASAPARP